MDILMALMPGMRFVKYPDTVVDVNSILFIDFQTRSDYMHPGE
jgi:hypothetical protein